MILSFHASALSRQGNGTECVLVQGRLLAATVRRIQREEKDIYFLQINGLPGTFEVQDLTAPGQRQLPPTAQGFY